MENKKELCVCGHPKESHKWYGDRYGMCGIHGCHPTFVGDNSKRCAVYRPKEASDGK